jgi:transcriptional regulator with XRE-family HTH domain
MVDLKRFGQTLRQLRKGADLTQAELAKQLAVSEQLLSIWERAYRHGERTWQPERASMVRLLTLFAARLTPEEAQIWAGQAGQAFNETELLAIFPLAVLRPQPLPDPYASRQRLDHLPDQRLFGRDEAQAKLESLLLAEGRPWLIALDGMGGMGKTSLAHTLAQTMLPTRRFYDLAWISARQEEFLPEGVLRPVNQPVLSVETFVDILLTRLDPSLILARAHKEKLAILSRWLKTQPYLVVVDNLETAVDYQSLLPLLQRLANPSKFLITSRYSLRTQGAGIHFQTLHGLSQADTAALLHYEAEIRDIPTLAQASPAQLESIHQVVGGNPLALKLVAGQLSVLPLAQVLDTLRQAGSKTVEDLYTYIYWQAWELLSPAAKQALVAMPLAQDGSFEEVMEESELDAAQAGQALAELSRLSLVEVGGDLEHPHYRIHRLTETFLLNEVIKWQAL